jgi:hypothetical protein
LLLADIDIAQNYYFNLLSKIGELVFAGRVVSDVYDDVWHFDRVSVELKIIIIILVFKIPPNQEFCAFWLTHVFSSWLCRKNTSSLPRGTEIE